MAKINIAKEMCKGCGLCVIFCPRSLLEIDKLKLNTKGVYPVKFKKGKCVGCLSCAIICPEAAIEVYK